MGELPQGTPNNLMPYITQTVMGKLKQLQVFGNDYPTRDRTAIRDYIHVVDLAIAHVKAMDYLLQNTGQPMFEVFNLGTGKGYTVLEVIETFEKITGKKLNFVVVERRDGDVPELYANADKALNKLGWKAERQLKDMISDCWKWEQNCHRERRK